MFIAFGFVWSNILIRIICKQTGLFIFCKKNYNNCIATFFASTAGQELAKTLHDIKAPSNNT